MDAGHTITEPHILLAETNGPMHVAITLNYTLNKMAHCTISFQWKWCMEVVHCILSIMWNTRLISL